MSNRPIPIYATNGDLGAYLAYPYIFNPQGEWIGWVTTDRQVFSVLGHYAGYLSSDARILRKRATDYTIPNRRPLPAPPRLVVPPSAPLAPLLAELSYEVVDVLMDYPEDLHPIDSGELKPDLD